MPNDEPGGLPQPVRQALERAAADAGVPASQATLLDYDRVEWPNASLGVPRPGMLYAQVITPGYRVRIDIAGRVVTFHTDLGRRVVRAAG